MENPSFVEKRAFSRFNIAIPLVYSEANSAETILAQTYDIDTEGLSIITDKQLPCGASLDICLRMVDNDEQIYRKGKVIWSDMLDSGKYRIGIKLEEPKLKPIPLVLRTIIARKKYKLFPSRPCLN